MDAESASGAAVTLSPNITSAHKAEIKMSFTKIKTHYLLLKWLLLHLPLLDAGEDVAHSITLNRSSMCVSCLKDNVMEFNLLNKLGAAFICRRNELGTGGKAQYCLLFPNWTRSISTGHGLAIKPDTKD